MIAVVVIAIVRLIANAVLFRLRLPHFRFLCSYCRGRCSRSWIWLVWMVRLFVLDVHRVLCVMMGGRVFMWIVYNSGSILHLNWGMILIAEV